jgi:hypothetical protein
VGAYTRRIIAGGIGLSKLPTHTTSHRGAGRL